MGFFDSAKRAVKKVISKPESLLTTPFELTGLPQLGRELTGSAKRKKKRAQAEAARLRAEQAGLSKEFRDRTNRDKTRRAAIISQANTSQKRRAGAVPQRETILTGPLGLDENGLPTSTGEPKKKKTQRKITQKAKPQNQGKVAELFGVSGSSLSSLLGRRTLIG